LKAIPDTEHTLVLRTDYADDAAWTNLCREIEKPVGEFRAYVEFLSDREYEGVTPEELVDLASGGSDRTFMFLVDRAALSDPEHPVLVLDLSENPGSMFRVIPSEIWGVENNLSIANMDFLEYAENADDDGVFRGFHD
jgi:hypothetical protein